MTPHPVIRGFAIPAGRVNPLRHVLNVRVPGIEPDDEFPNVGQPV